MATTDAKHIPVKNAAYRLTFPIFDADGDLVTGATGLDSEVSIDGGTFTDCTNEATEIATSSGMYYLDLTAAEMNGDTIAVIVKTSSSGAKTTPLVLYTAARSVNDLAYPTVSGRSLDVSAGGEAGIDLANVGSPTTTLNLSGTTIKTATDVEADTQDIQGRLPAALVSGKMSSDVTAISGDAPAADALETMLDGTGGNNLSLAELNVTQGAQFSATNTRPGLYLFSGVGVAQLPLNILGSSLAGMQIRSLTNEAVYAQSAGAYPVINLFNDDGGDSLDASSGRGIVGNLYGLVNGIAGTLQTLDALWSKIKKWLQLALRKDAAIATDNATELTEINANGGSGAGAFANTTDSLEAQRDNTDAQLTAIDDYLDTEVAAIKAKTDNLPADPADASDIAALFATVNGKLDAIDDFLDTEIAAILADTTELADTVLADSVPADGSLGTLKQTLYEIRQFLFEATVSGTTVTSKKTDGSTTLETFTTNSATAPTSITRSG